MLQGLGFFIDSLWDDELPAPQELVGSDPRLEEVANYLDRGVVRERYRGISWCRFCCGEREMGNCDLTDGVWVWPEGLSHYLRIHSVRLPETFILHALDWLPTKSSEPEDPVDLQTWAEWCRPRRIESLRAKIDEARREDDRLEAAARQTRVEANTAKFGEGESKCIQAGCAHRALRGLVFCAHHLPEMTCGASFHTHSSRLLAEALRSSC